MYIDIHTDKGNRTATRALSNLKYSKHNTDMPDTPVLTELLDMVNQKQCL